MVGDFSRNLPVVSVLKPTWIYWTMSKMAVRKFCRGKWGRDWYKVHPFIKKARMEHAVKSLEGWGEVESVVFVRENGEAYVV